jgi:hypothetical protein
LGVQYSDRGEITALFFVNSKENWYSSSRKQRKVGTPYTKYTFLRPEAPIVYLHMHRMLDWRNWYLGIDSWAPEKLKNSGLEYDTKAQPEKIAINFSSTAQNLIINFDKCILTFTVDRAYKHSIKITNSAFAESS